MPGQRLRNAITGAERAARLTQQLLAFARRQPLRPKVIAPGRVMGEVADLLRRTLGETIEVECVIGGGLWNPMADVAQLENAILNLSLNARDAMPAGGKLTIEVANAFLNDDYVERNSEAEPGQYVMITVTDTGVGMTPEQVSRAFEPFYTTKPEGQGTGLGLSQVYGFVKQSGGHIKIYSEKGVGTSVKVYLPRVRRAEEGLPVQLATAASPAGGECVLVVEDEAAVRTATVDTLEQLGYKVLQASDGSGALEILRSNRPIDLLFTDVVMPGPVASRDLARQAVEMQPGIAVLFTSGYTENAIIHHGRLDEGVHLLSKPYRKDELARKLRSVLDARAHASAPAAAAPHRLKVLVVEDEELVRMATLDMISALGHEVMEAANGATARRVLERAGPIDILFTDLGLPDTNGAALAAELRAQQPGLKVVIATGYSDAVASEGQAIIGLAKPFNAEDIQRVISRLMSGQDEQRRAAPAVAAETAAVPSETSPS